MKRLMAILLTLSVLVSMVPMPALASHAWDNIVIGQVEVYRHVLENDDRLYLLRYILVEEPPAGESAYGPSGAVLTLFNNSTALLRQTPPSTGYALAAFYQSAATASAWNSANLSIVLAGNPTIFSAPQSSTVLSTDTNWTWNSTSTMAETAQELTDDLPAIMLNVESDAPADVYDAGSLVNGSGITDTGAGIVEDAFAPLIAIAPEAFVTSQYVVGTPIPIPTPGSHAQDVDLAVIADNVLAADVASGATTITVVSGADFRKGQKVRVTDDTGNADTTVVAAVSGATLTLGDPLTNAYTQADNAKAQILSPVKDDLVLLGQGWGLAEYAVGAVLLAGIIGILAAMLRMFGPAAVVYALMVSLGMAILEVSLQGLIPLALGAAVITLVGIAGASLLAKRLLTGG